MSHCENTLYLIHNAAAWLFLDETLVKKREISSMGSSGEIPIDPPNSTDSGIELLQPSDSTYDTDSNHSVILPLVPRDSDDDGNDDSINGDEEMNMDENESEPLTDSEYDANSDTTELLRCSKSMKHYKFVKHLKEHGYSCLRAFDPRKLVRKMVQRLTECVGGFVMCAACLFTFEYGSKCRPDYLRLKLSNGHSIASGLKKSLMLVVDRRVFISILLYAWMAFLSIIQNEVRVTFVYSYHYGHNLFNYLDCTCINNNVGWCAFYM